jgi:hypothetical protein
MRRPQFAGTVSQHSNHGVGGGLQLRAEKAAQELTPATTAHARIGNARFPRDPTANTNTRWTFSAVYGTRAESGGGGKATSA